MNTAMHQEAFPGEDISDRPPPAGQRARAARAARRRPAQRSLPRRRPQGRHLSAQHAFELPERLEAHAPPEARGLARDDVRMLVATRRRPPRPRAGARPARLPALRRPRRHQHLGHAAGRAARAPHGRRRARAAPLDAAAGRRATTAGSSSCAPAPSPSAAGAPATSCELPGGGQRDARGALPHRRAPVGRPARSARAAAGLPGPPRRADPLPLRPRRAPARRPTRRPTRPSPAAPRCPAPGARSPRRC